MTTAFAARYAHDLEPLTADLPPSPPQAPGWRALGVLAREQVRATVTRDFVRRHRWRLAAAAVLALLLLVLFGAVVGHLVFGGGGFYDGGGGYYDGGGFDGPRGGFGHYRG